MKSKQIEEHDKLKPAEVAVPTEAMSPEQKQAAEGLAAASQQVDAARKRSQEIAGETTELAKRQKAIGNIREQLRLLQRAFDQAEKTVSDDLNLLGFAWSDLAAIDIKTAVLEEKSTELATKQGEIKIEAEKLAEVLNSATATQQGFTAKLNAPQQQYEAYQRQLAEWNTKRDELIGSITDPETKVGLETRIEQIEELPQQLKVLEARRLQLSGEIFDTLDAQRRARAELFKPVQDLIQKNVLIREDYRLQFQATLAASADAIADQLFALIKQTAGDFRGQDEAPATIRRLFDGHDLNSKDGALAFIASLQEKVLAAAKASGSDAGIFSLLKKGQPAAAVYDLIFGLNFLEPRYSLLFQDTQIEQLSPGQRGALLLIFYLLVDKGKTPIILDQPEENLDNETVFRLLVPVLSEAKKQRQIIMVTHNPNLAVVCDAEQIIHARFDRASDSTIRYESGAIENTGLNEAVVTILEGTKPAFENRYGKYH